jgi:hypothetical protein
MFKSINRNGITIQTRRNDQTKTNKVFGDEGLHLAGGCADSMMLHVVSRMSDPRPPLKIFLTLMKVQEAKCEDSSGNDTASSSVGNNSTVITPSVDNSTVILNPAKPSSESSSPSGNTAKPFSSLPTFPLLWSSPSSSSSSSSSSSPPSNSPVPRWQQFQTSYELREAIESASPASTSSSTNSTPNNSRPSTSYAPPQTPRQNSEADRKRRRLQPSIIPEIPDSVLTTGINNITASARDAGHALSGNDGGPAGVAAVNDVKLEAVNDVKLEAVNDVKLEAVNDVKLEAANDTASGSAAASPEGFKLETVKSETVNDGSEAVNSGGSAAASSGGLEAAHALNAGGGGNAGGRRNPRRRRTFEEAFAQLDQSCREYSELLEQAYRNP